MEQGRSPASGITFRGPAYEDDDDEDWDDEEEEEQVRESPSTCLSLSAP